MSVRELVVVLPNPRWIYWISLCYSFYSETLGGMWRDTWRNLERHFLVLRVVRVSVMLVLCCAPSKKMVQTTKDLDLLDLLDLFRQPHFADFIRVADIALYGKLLMSVLR